MIILRKKDKIRLYLRGKRKVKFRNVEFYVTKKYAKELQNDLNNLELLIPLTDWKADTHFSTDGITENLFTVYIYREGQFPKGKSLYFYINDKNVLRKVMFKCKDYTFFNVPIKRVIEAL